MKYLLHSSRWYVFRYEFLCIRVQRKHSIGFVFHFIIIYSRKETRRSVISVISISVCWKLNDHLSFLSEILCSKHSTAFTRILLWLTSSSRRSLDKHRDTLFHRSHVSNANPDLSPLYICFSSSSFLFFPLLRIANRLVSRTTQSLRYDFLLKVVPWFSNEILEIDAFQWQRFQIWAIPYFLQE